GQQELKQTRSELLLVGIRQTGARIDAIGRARRGQVVARSWVRLRLRSTVAGGPGRWWWVTTRRYVAPSPARRVTATTRRVATTRRRTVATTSTFEHVH